MSSNNNLNNTPANAIEEQTERKHSVLSPSSSKVWLTCTPSAAMCEQFPDKESVYSTEGTLAHALAEYKVRKNVLGDNTAVDPHIEHDGEITEEMEKCTDMYLNYVAKTVKSFEEEGFAAEVFTEKTLDLSFCIPEGKGTADLVIIADNVITVIDFKYGAFTKVPGEENTQMMIYALGAEKLFTQDGYGPFETVSMTIFQPRMDNVNSFKMSLADLKKWETETLIPKAEAAIKGAGDLVKGDHCELCKARNFCKLYRAESIKNMETIKIMKNELENTMVNTSKKERTAAAIANLLSLEDIAKILVLSEGLETWSRAVKDRALAEALDGKIIPGFKLIEKAGNDVVTDAAATKFADYGYDPYKPAAYKSKTAMKEEMKADQNEKIFVTEIVPLMEKGPATPALVACDKNGTERSAEYFKKKAEAENGNGTLVIDAEGRLVG